MLVVVALLVVLIAIGVPVAFAVLGASTLYFLTSAAPETILIQRLTSGVTPFPLLAIPFFILAGVIMANGGIAQRILGFADSLIGHRRGGLAQVNVLNSVIMGGMTGSGNADAAVDAKVLVPIMTKFGYDKAFSTALSVATGVIAPIIPPGIGLIIYGYLAEVSIGRLFVAGVVPGALLAVALSVAVSIVSRKRGYGAARDSRPPTREILHQGRRAFWALMMPVLLLVGLRIGVFTPTELGGVAVLYALVISLVVYREITLKDLPQILRESVVATSVVVLIVAAGSAFGWIITTERIPQAIVESVVGLSTNPLLILLLLNLALLVMGALIDATALLVILAPIMAPVGASLGVDPVHFGIVIVLNLTIGAITPPLGSILYTACAITGTTVEEYTAKVSPSSSPSSSSCWSSPSSLCCPRPYPPFSTADSPQEDIHMQRLRYRQAVAQALADEMDGDPTVIVMGEDVAQAGGAFKATDGLLDRFGPTRVIDTPISELGFLGAGVGAAMAGLRPVVEMMFIEFVGVALDQLVTEAATVRYLSRGSYHVPLVVRGSVGAGQGFGCQHSQVLDHWFRGAPGLKVCMPATPQDAYGLIRTAVQDPDPVVVLEPRVLYGIRGEVMTGPEGVVPLGRARTVRSGSDVTIVAVGAMVGVAEEAASSGSFDAEVVDLRTLKPWDRETVLESVARTGRLVTVEESPPATGWGADVVAVVAHELHGQLQAAPLRITPPAAPVPFAAELESRFLPSMERVIDQVALLLDGRIATWSTT